MRPKGEAQVPLAHIQKLIDEAFASHPTITRQEILNIVRSSAALHPDEEEWFVSLPEGSYNRPALIAQLNEIIRRLDPELTRGGPVLR